jgi:hypothetical protein
MLIPNTNSNPNLNMMAIKVGVKNLTKLFFICFIFNLKSGQDSNL